MYNSTYRQSVPITNPQYYQQKANQLRLQNQILKRQLQTDNTQPIRYQRKYSPEFHKTFTRDFIKEQIPQKKIIYRKVGEPVIASQFKRISPQKYYEQPKFIQRLRTQTYNAIPDQNLIQQNELRSMQHRHRYINQIEQQIIDLQTRGYKLQRQANKLSSYIKEDLRDFVKDSNIHKECNYKQKYLRAIANRPRHLRIHM